MDCFLGRDSVIGQITFVGECEELLTCRMELGKFKRRFGGEC